MGSGPGPRRSKLFVEGPRAHTDQSPQAKQSPSWGLGCGPTPRQTREPEDLSQFSVPRPRPGSCGGIWGIGVAGTLVMVLVKATS